MQPDRFDTTGRLRLGVYASGLAGAFVLYFIVQGPHAGPVFWAAGLAVALLLVAGALRPIMTHGQLYGWAVLSGLALALSMPLGPALGAGLSVAHVAVESPLWPQALVALFASRVLTEIGEHRFAAFWQAPTRLRGAVSLQSNAAAVALGAALTLLFYQAQILVPGQSSPDERSDPGLGRMVTHALAGESAVHRAIVFLFFLVLACLIDAALRHRRDREILFALRRQLAGHPDGTGHLAALLSSSLRPFAHTRTVRILSRTLVSRSRDPADEAFEGFHAAARRFVRGLLPLLPLLGFFGTVVGLSTAMAALPTQGGHGPIDLSGSFSGLALKFETTLLGLLASILAAVLLASLEKSEAELSAECALLAAQERADVAR